MANMFPRVTDHAKVNCFNCGESLKDAKPQASGNAPRWGQYVKGPCATCGMKTWYDHKAPRCRVEALDASH